MKVLRTKEFSPQGLQMLSRGLIPWRIIAGRIASPQITARRIPWQTRGQPMTYWRLHYHLIWATCERQPWLVGEREKMFYGVLYGKATDLGLKLHAAGNIADHVHIVLSIPPKLALADCVKHIKGASAFAINHLPDSDGKFKWQEGYGALSLGERSLETVMAYAANQKEHHRQQTLRAVFERIDEP